MMRAVAFAFALLFVGAHARVLLTGSDGEVDVKGGVVDLSGSQSSSGYAYLDLKGDVDHHGAVITKSGDVLTDLVVGKTKVRVRGDVDDVDVEGGVIDAEHTKFESGDVDAIISKKTDISGPVVTKSGSVASGIKVGKTVVKRKP